jgi:hypothetical protein
MMTFKAWRGHPLNWLDDDRSGLPRVDPFFQTHLFNPFYFSEDGGFCACRLCEPSMWWATPLPLTFDGWLPVEPPRAKNGSSWPDLDSELYEKLAEFTPLE